MEKEVKENVTVKAVEDNPSDAIPQNKEAAVLQQAVDSGDVAPEFGLQEDGVYKVNVDEPPKPIKKENKDAIQKPSSKSEVLRDEQPEVGLRSVGQEVRETPENAEDVKEEKVIEIPKEEKAAEVADSPLELVTENKEKAVIEEPVQIIEPEPIAEEQIQEKKTEYPEDVEKLVKFMEETGGTVSDYTRLNRDVSTIDNLTLLREYYEHTKPHLDREDISFLMDKNFAYDKELDDPSDIRAKQLAFKEELYNAQNTLNSYKEKYYTDLKLRKKNDVPKDYQRAMKYYNTTQQLIKKQAQSKKDFLKETSNVFANDFKGFDFKVGESKYRYKVDNTKKVQEFQSDINNFLGQFQDDKGFKDAGKYHKALFAAQNADKIANHFYEQGRADAIKDSARKAKNINMDPRSDASSVVTKSGNTIRVLSGDSSDKLRIKWK